VELIDIQIIIVRIQFIGGIEGKKLQRSSFHTPKQIFGFCPNFPRRLFFYFVRSSRLNRYHLRRLLGAHYLDSSADEAPLEVKICI
jgi:hypothetical protein